MGGETPRSFSVATYNLLAAAYIHRGWYPRSPAMVLNPVWRVPALVGHVAGLDADILCLQEVEPAMFAALRASLGEGYGAEYARKRASQPDGLAIFYRRQIFRLTGARVLTYADGAGVAPDSGYVAMFALLQHAAGDLGVVNTHLAWEPPDTPQPRRSLLQAHQLAAELRSKSADARGWIMTGDFNATPESDIVSMIEQSGFRYAHAGLANVFTCNVNSDPRMIDYIFYSSTLTAMPTIPERIDDRTVLPSAEQPSDHIALLSKFTWVD